MADADGGGSASRRAACSVTPLFLAFCFCCLLFWLVDPEPPPRSSTHALTTHLLTYHLLTPPPPTHPHHPAAHRTLMTSMDTSSSYRSRPVNRASAIRISSTTR